MIVRHLICKLDKENNTHSRNLHKDDSEKDIFLSGNWTIKLEEAKAIAPPDPPSPMIIEIFGTVNDIEHSIELAIAEACPLCSAPMPG